MAKNAAQKPAQKSRLSQMRSEVTTPQAQLLNLFWEHYQQNCKWPATRFIHSQHGGKQHVRKGLQKLSRAIVMEQADHQGVERYQLTILGALLTKEGDTYRVLLVRYLTFLREQFYLQPDKLDFTDKDFSQALDLSDEQRILLGELIHLSSLFGGYGGGPDSWRITVPREVEDLPKNGPLDKALEALLFRRFETALPIFIDDRQKHTSALSNYSVAPADFSPDSSNRPSSAGAISSIDPFKRRYQVFVSSTYEDLKEERQHVIQALLETKCIPTGMELFPAASLEQWQLIQRVIDECDYYFVIVAGRYGSLNKEGTSYTEKEFDYANEIGRPVIGFYYKNPDDLPNSKSEKSDVGRRHLKAFVEKVKQRVCRPWSSPAELGSAVKSAIIHELEFTPKPGWIRADAVPPSDAVEKLKQRVADLEERLKLQKSQARSSLPDGKQSIEIPVSVDYDFAREEGEFGDWLRIPQKTVQQTVMLTWDEIVLILAGRLQKGQALDELHSFLDSHMKKRLLPIISKLEGCKDPHFVCCSDTETLESILKTLMARKLVRMKPSYYGSWSVPNWQFTAKGFQYLSELQAIRSAK